MTLQDWAAQKCTISYRAPELFNVESHCIVDERTDIWVSSVDIVWKAQNEHNSVWPIFDNLFKSIILQHLCSHSAVCFTV